MTDAELSVAAAQMREAIMLSARWRLRAEVAVALDVDGGVYVVPRDHLPAGVAGEWDPRTRRINLSAALSMLDALPVFAHEAAHRAQDSVPWLPSSTPHHCPCFAGLACGLERRWSGQYTGDPQYDLADRPFLMSCRAAIRIARRCAERARRMPIDAAVRACWFEVLVVEGLWRLGEFLECHVVRLLFLAVCLSAVALSHFLSGLLAAAETAFMLIVAGWAAASITPNAFDFPFSLNQRSK